MFTMMNQARLGCRLQGLSQAPRPPIRTRSTYARERLQGRAVTGPEAPDKPADPIIVHPDVRRMLMDQKGLCRRRPRALLIAAESRDTIGAAGTAKAERRRLTTCWAS